MESIEFKQEIEAIYNKEKSLSFSSLKAFCQSPRHFYRYKTEKTTTEAMMKGVRFHMAILEPDKFNDKYWILDDEEICNKIGGAKPRATAKYKEWKDKEIELNSGKELINKDEFDLLMSTRDYLYICSATKDLLDGLIYKEKSFEYEFDGFLISGKIDGEGNDYLLDLKHVADASFKKIRWIIEDMMYHMQGSIYCNAVKKKNYYLIFVDNSINVTVVKLTQDKLTEGFLIFTTALENFRTCIEEDKFYFSYEFYNNGYINY